MTDIVFTAAVVLGAIPLVVRRARAGTVQEARLLWALLATRIGAALAHILVTDYYFRGGDLILYHQTGVLIADAIRFDPGTFVPITLTTFLQLENDGFPFVVNGLGSSTASLHALSGLLHCLLGDSLYAVGMLVSLAAMWGSLQVYDYFKRSFDPLLHRPVFLALCLVPTAVFWTSSLLKEAIAVFGLGVVFRALSAVRAGAPVAAAPWLVLGLGAAFLSKPYTLLPLSLGLAAWLVIARSAARSTPLLLKPFYVVLAFGLAIIGVAALGYFFPKYALDRVAETAAYQQDVGQRVVGGSTYEMGNPEERTLLGQLLFAPWGLITALFRPLLFEARSAAAFVNAIETTTLTALAVRGIVLNSWRATWRRILGSPPLAYSLVFTLVLAAAVGLSTTNFGTLSRYRAPLVPFFALLVVVLSPRTVAASNVPHPPRRSASRSPTQRA